MKDSTTTPRGEAAACPATVGMDLTAPFGVYVNGECVAEHATEAAAQALYSRLLGKAAA